MLMEPQMPAAEVARRADLRSLHAFASVVALFAVVTVVFWPTASSIVAIWSRSDTFAHGFLVLPAVLWIVWSSRAELAATPTHASWPGLLGLALAGLVWLFGELADALVVAQGAMVAMIPCGVLALYGAGWLRVLAFPLAFLFFAVPVGEAFVPTLIDWTADFTVSALVASGVPVFREGNQFVIPSGRWSVVEACSGIRYLIASVFVGVLYAWMMYRSPLKRALFVGASALVPLVANWVRAYLIVMIGHLSGNRLAVGVDHLIYGWVFFGIVIALLFWIGARWREDGRFPSRKNPLRFQVVETSVGRKSTLPAAWFVALAVALILAGPLARTALAETADARPVTVAPIAAGGAWTTTSVPAADWAPVLEGPVQVQTASFKRDGAIVTVHVGWYRNQRQGSELVNSMNRLVPDKGIPWNQVARGTEPAAIGGESAVVRTATLRRPGQTVRIWQWYWLGSRTTTSDTRAKLALALDRLLARSDTSAWVALSTSAEDDAAADRILDAFARDMGASLQRSLAETGAR